MTTNSQVLEMLVVMKNTTQADFTALRNDFMKSQEQSDALTGAINRLAVSVDDLSKSQKGNVAASDVMAGGQARASASLTATTASAGQLASVLQTELRVATEEAAQAAFLQNDAYKDLLPRVEEAQAAVSQYGQALRDVNQDVTAVGGNLRANFRDALAQATTELLNENEILAETAVRLNQTEFALLKFEAAEKKAAASTVQASSDATYALMRESQAAINAAETVSAKAQTVIAAEAKEAAGVRASEGSNQQEYLRSERALLRLGGQTAGIRQGFALAGVSAEAWAAIIGGAAVYEAAKFENEMVRLQANTGATTGQMKIMQAAVLDLGQKGPASLDDLAVGIRHVSDLGYRGVDSVTVLTEAWKAAIATGGKVADVSNALATVLGNQHAPASQAAKDIDIIVTAAQQGNMTVQDFATHFSRIGTIMSSVNQPLADGAALLATFSRATADPAIAQTYGQNMLMHIINPTKAATTEMATLKRATGIDLQEAFQEFAQGQIRIQDVLALSRLALQGNVGETEKLFGGLRGGQGALIATISHWQDYNQITGKVNSANKTVQDSFDKMSGTTEFKLKTLKNDVIEVGIAMGQQFQPAFNHSIDTLTTTLPSAIDQAIGYFKRLEQEIKAVGYDLTHIPVPKLPGTGGGANPITSQLGLPSGPLDLVKDAFMGSSYGKALTALDDANKRAAKDVADAKKRQDEYNTSVQAWGGGVDVATLKQRAATEALNAWAGGLTLTAVKQQAHAKAIHDTNTELQYGMSLMDQMANGPQYKNLLGPGTVGAMPLGQNYQPILSLQDAIAAATKKQTDAVNQAYTDQQALGHVTAQHEAALRGANARLTELQDELTSFTSSAKSDAARLNAPFLADAKAVELHAKAMTSALATIHSVSAAAVSAADALSGRAASQTQGDMAPITRSVPSVALPYLSGAPAPSTYANSRPYGGTPQYDATIQDHGTYQNAEAISPTDRAAMAKLSASIDQLPEQFRGSFDGEITKLHQSEQDNYNHYIDQVNKENIRHAAALTKAQKEHDDAVAKANEKAQKDLAAENDRYLHQLDDLETRHNQALSDHLASFNVAFQSAMATFESNMVADTQKAEAERQSHNDKLTADYGDLQQRLAGIHGKNAAQLRENAWADYNRRVTHDDQVYGAQVTLMDNHVKGQAKAFTDHINGIKTTLSNANANSDKTLSRAEGTAAHNRTTAITGIRGTLQASVNTADFTLGGRNETENARHATALGPTGTASTTLTSRNAATQRQAAADATPEAMMAKLTSGGDTQYNKAYAQVFMDLMDHSKNLKADTAALQKATTDRGIITDAQNKANQIATANLYDFATAVSATTKAISDDKNVLAGIIVHPDDGNAEATRNRANPLPGQSQQGILQAQTYADLTKQLHDQAKQTAANLEVDKQSAIIMGDWNTAASDAKTQWMKGATTEADYVNLQQKANAETDRQNALMIDADQKLGDFIGAATLSKQAFLDGKESLDKYIADQQLADNQLKQQNDRQIQYDQATGDTADALKLLTDEYHKHQRSVEDVTAAYQANQDSIHQTNQQDILLDQRVGNTADALKLVTDEYRNGYDSLQQLTDAYNANKDAVEKTTQQDLAFYMSTGQFGQALSTLTSQITQGATDSQAKVTLDVLTGNQAAMKADTDSAIAHREAQDALTSATWDATYATASAAIQSQMRSSLAQPMISQQSTVQGAESAVFTAQLGVIAARSAVQISLMQAEVTATNDLAGIVSAQAGVAKAQGDKLLAGINDQIPVMNDNHAIAEDLKSGNAQQLQIDKQQLLIDVTTAQMNQVVAQWQITLAQDQLKMAQDKMLVDQLNAAAAYAVAVDNLQIAQDNVAVVQAQSQIQIDQLSVQTDISTSLGSVIDYLTMIDGDLQNLQAAQDQMQSDQSTLADDTSNQNFVNMSGQGILAGDSLGLASDQANSQSAQQAYELQIEQYKVQLNAFQLQQKDSTTNAQSTAALEAMVRLLQNMIVNLNSPAGRTVRAAGVGGVSLAHLQNSFAASAYTTQLPMGFA